MRPEHLWLPLLCVLSACLPEALTAWLEYRRDAILAGEVWRLLSGHFVHYSFAHAILDGLALAMLLSLLDRLGVRSRPLARFGIIAVLLGALLLVAVPDMRVYRGASGLVLAACGMLVVALWRTPPAWRSGSVLLSLLLAAKIWVDAFELAALPNDLPPGVHVAWQAHAAGLALGLAWEKFSGRAAA